MNFSSPSLSGECVVVWLTSQVFDRAEEGSGEGMKRGRGNSGARYREERVREEGSSSSLSRSGHEG